MTIARHYVMITKPAEAEALHVALVALAIAVQQIEGGSGIDLLRDTREPERFIFIERWASIDAYEAGGKRLPKKVFAPVMAALAGPPEACYLEHLPLD